jgi:sigma-B regulation protein RsbU (phosphoserine phosphatase)
MFIPCDHCLRRHATRKLYVTEAGRRELLRLCNSCYEKENRGSFFSPSPPPSWPSEEEIAMELQANLLPSRSPRAPGYDLSAWYRPARRAGGDYFDYLDLDDQHLGLLVADVSGRGVPALTVMTETRALMKSESARTLSPLETMARVNRTLQRDIRRGMFVTMFYAVLDIARATLSCVSAGHNPMLLSRPTATSLVNPNGLALGIDKGPLFEKTLKEQTIALAPGDRFTFYTDGVIESMNGHSEQFGQNRFYLRVKQLADRSSPEFLSRLAAELDAHRGGAPQNDDITILTGRYIGGA